LANDNSLCALPRSLFDEKLLYNRQIREQVLPFSQHASMGNLKKKRRLKIAKHKRRKRSKANRHKKRTW